MSFETEIKFSRLSVSSLSIGVISVVLLLPSSIYRKHEAVMFFLLIFAILFGLALIITIAAIIRVVKSRDRKKGIGMAIWGLIVTLIAGLINLGILVYELSDL
ncbi:TPA: hypothetical protein DCR49_07290 [Candidatus Delongbacteria bacterium]|nr:hypothetical protein [Candidatus Delongbacteria bacterium]